MVLCVCIVVGALAAQPAADDLTVVDVWGCFAGVKDSMSRRPSSKQPAPRRTATLTCASMAWKGIIQAVDRQVQVPDVTICGLVVRDVRDADDGGRLRSAVVLCCASPLAFIC
jgi:hypothetical protein